MENIIFLNLTVEASFLSQTQNRISEKESLMDSKVKKFQCCTNGHIAGETIRNTQER